MRHDARVPARKTPAPGEPGDATGTTTGSTETTTGTTGGTTGDTAGQADPGDRQTSDPRTRSVAVQHLYALAPSDFVAARDELISAAKQDKDRELARQLGTLRRPTLGAWMVNTLARERADDLESLLALGPALQEAAAVLSAQDLRSLSAQRNKVLGALVATAHRLAARAGLRVDSTAEAEAQDTLAAALADPVAADRVRTGTLARGLRHTGFGPAPEDLGAHDPSGPGVAPNSPIAAGRKARANSSGGRPEDPALSAAAQKAAAARIAAAKKRAAQVAQAQTAVQAAENDLAEREQAAVEAADAAARLGEELAQARERVQDLERRSAEASLDGRSAQSAVRDGRAALQRAQRALERARAAGEADD